MSSQLLPSLDFDSKTSFMDSMEPAFPYMENGLEYLQYPTQSPAAFDLSVGLPPAASPLAFNSLTLSGEYTYGSPSFNPSSPERSYTPPDATGLSPAAVTYNLSNGDLVSEGTSSGRHSRNSSTGSASVSYAATVPRSHRFNPIGVASNRPNLRSRRRNSSKASEEMLADTVEAEEDDDEEFQPASLPSSQINNDARREVIRKQRIESEQRRRDELRDGYTRLKETLPTSNQKSSKVSLLDRATSHIRYLETVKEQLENRLKAAEAEVHRLRGLNETLMLNSAQRQIAGAAGLGPQY